jgi:hypothetical protein
MTEHVQVEIIAAVAMLAGQALTIWRAELAARRASEANIAAVGANTAAVKAATAVTEVSTIATESRREQAAAIEQVHQAVNGGMAAQKAEIVSLKEQLVIAKAADAEPPVTAAARQEERRDK